MIDMLIPDEWVSYLEKIKSKIDMLNIGLSNEPYFITTRTITKFDEYFICQKKFTRYTILNKDTCTQKKYAEAFAQVFFNNLSDNEKNIFKRINRHIYNILRNSDIYIQCSDFCWPFYVIEALQKYFYKWDKTDFYIDNESKQPILKINKSLQEQGFGEL